MGIKYELATSKNNHWCHLNAIYLKSLLADDVFESYLYQTLYSKPNY